MAYEAGRPGPSIATGRGEGFAITTNPIQRTTQAEYIRVQLEDRIHRGLLKPGEALDEKQLAQEFSVSRTPVREAIRQLEAVGIVKARGRQGAMVASLTPRELQDTVEVLTELFAFAVRLAAERASPEMRALLQSKTERGPLPGRDAAEAYLAFFEDLRLTILFAAGNAVLPQILSTHYDRLYPYRRPLSELADDYMQRSLAGLTGVVDTILAGDPDKAEAAMRHHARTVTLAPDGIFGPMRRILRTE